MNSIQKASVTNITEARDNYKNGKESIEKRVRAALREELDAVELELAIAVRRARQLGVPVAVIANDGLGVLDRGTVYRWLKRTEDMHVASINNPEAFNAFAWGNDEHTEINVRFVGFPTTVTAEDYPKILEGTVNFDVSDDGSRLFSITEDPMTEMTPEGELPGWLTYEVEEVSELAPKSLVSMLNEWIEAQS